MKERDGGGGGGGGAEALRCSSPQRLWAAEPLWLFNLGPLTPLTCLPTCFVIDGWFFSCFPDSNRFEPVRVEN